MYFLCVLSVLLISEMISYGNKLLNEENTIRHTLKQNSTYAPKNGIECNFASKVHFLDLFLFAHFRLSCKSPFPFFFSSSPLFRMLLASGLSSSVPCHSPQRASAHPERATIIVTINV